jgi:hemoglobin
MSSLYESLGGAPAVDAAVDIFYRKVLTDDRVAPFFDDVDMDRQAAKQKAFLTMVFGGPANYTGQDMRRGHAHLVARGMNDTHVDVVIGLLGETLQELGVPAAQIGQVAAIANSVRDDVLNRGPSPAPSDGSCGTGCGCGGKKDVA